MFSEFRNDLSITILDRFSPLLIGARCSAKTLIIPPPRLAMFQSPPHRGTVFSTERRLVNPGELYSFSPLLIGARCSASASTSWSSSHDTVSVPSSSGHGVQPAYCPMVAVTGSGFSPLLIGARCSAARSPAPGARPAHVSVPSSSGHGVQHDLRRTVR